jgi:Thermostable hemolysin
VIAPPSKRETSVADQQHRSLVQRFLNPSPQFQLLTPRSGARSTVNQFIRDRYHAAYGAEVTHFLPWLLTMQCLDQLTGTAGLQPATPSPLFLEQYLPAPVETVLAGKLGAAVHRHSLVEVGNLVAARKGASHLLFLLFTAVLYEAGYQWIVFTATHGLRNNLEKLGFPLLALQQVQTAAVPDTLRSEWGTYFAAEPVVMAGSLEDAMRLIETTALYRRIARIYRERIRELATHLRSSVAHAA